MKYGVTYTDNSGPGPEEHTQVVEADSYKEACEIVLKEEGWDSLESFEKEADSYDYQIDAWPIDKLQYVAILTDSGWVPEIAYVQAKSKELALELAKDEFVNSGRCEKEEIGDTINITVHLLPNKYQL